MLRLRHQVSCNEDWVALALLANEHGFGRTSQELNGAIESNQFLGSGHVPVAGTNNLVHARNALRPIGQRGDCLCSANAVELAHAKKCGRRQSSLDRAWRHHTNPRHPCDLRRNHRHQQRGRQWIAAAGNIAPHRFYGAYQLSHRNSGLNFAPPLLWFLPLAVSANVACGLRDRVLQFRASSLPGFMQVSLGHAQRFAAAQPIPPLRVSS